jgi:outer membrane receptor for ferrienterochelin and colicin
MKYIIISLVVANGVAAAGEPPMEATDVEDLSLAALLDTQVDVASLTPQTTRETPGIVTVITRADIADSGARDLLDVLVLVPGFTPAVDVEGVIDLGVRGQWGHEGKVLLLIDGHQMNELLYSTLQLANHYPLQAIERIEVIRGPGSAIYGGFAELAVINIVTRQPDSFDGVAVSGSYGQLGHALGHADLSLTFATKQTGIEGLSATGAFSVGHASTRGTYRDFAGDSYAMDGNSGRDPMFAKVGIEYRGLKLDGIVDNYSMQMRDGVGDVMAETVRQGFRAYHLNASYALDLGADLTLTPRLGLVRQTPWEIADRDSPVFYRKSVARYTAGATLTYTPTKRVALLAGVETFADRAKLEDTDLTGFQTMFGDSHSVAYDTIATFAQGQVQHRIANLTLGARYEHHSAVGDSLVPRIALTRVFGNLHAKALVSQAFRAPGIENINLSDGSLRPEKTTVFEAELGYKLTDNMFVALNAFDITINRPIVYEVDAATLTEGYSNRDRTGTRGFEVDYRVKYKRGYADVNYSYYTARGKNEVAAYAVPGHDEALLAFPSHKVAMTGHLDVYRGLAFTPSMVVYGKRYGYTSADSEGTPMIGTENATAIVNLYARYKDLLVPGLELGAGVNDVANQHFNYLQPYRGAHAPLPAPGREVVVRINYEWKL